MGCRCPNDESRNLITRILSAHENFAKLARTKSWVDMGCRYPKETMELVEELAFGVVQEYREQQKGRLKRTFVGAADAAGAKVNRGKAKTS